MMRRAAREVQETDSLGPQIRALAVPAFFTLVAEPLFLMTDSSIVGHLGVTQLAALGAASAVLLSLTGIFVFLAYATTALVARRMGANDEDGAIGAGLDGVWLALALSIPLAAATFAAAPLAVRAMTSAPDVVDAGVTYLRISALGIPAMLVCLAAQGLLRGLQDTRTPLLVTVTGFALNAALNAILVLGLHTDLAGSAAGTTAAQWLMALALLASIGRRVRHLDVRPHPGRVLGAARAGAPILVRTIALRAVLLLTTATAGLFGPGTLAAHQIASTIFTFLTFALDAVAIAAQALVGESLGRGDASRTRELTATLTRWGWRCGLVGGVATLATAWWVPLLFTSDATIAHTTSAALVVIALVSAPSGVLFVHDGVLMGAGDGAFLARAQLALLVGYLPLVRVLSTSRDAVTGWGDAAPLVAVWVLYALYLLARMAVLDHRRRGTAWMHLESAG